MKERIESGKKILTEKLTRATSVAEVESIRVEVLGRKGLLRTFLEDLKKAPPEERPALGKLINEFKQLAEQEIEKRLKELTGLALEERHLQEKLDVTLPGSRPPRGNWHILTKTLKKILEVFLRMGFEVVDGPEMEEEYYNFEALNIPWFHPARDEQDSFYIEKGWLLRTQTSPVQIRVMKERKPPFRIISPGKVYRRDPFDARHSPCFHQIEGLMVGEKVSFSDLKGILDLFCKEIFGEGTSTRFRPSYFPFTEPSAEVDISCQICHRAGCPVCKRTGWVEILGCGMVHPRVFKNVGYNPKKIQGFAFGMGLERITMLIHRIDDIRLFYENDLRFLRQF